MDVLRRTRETLSEGTFAAWAFVSSRADASFDPAAYPRQIDLIQTFDGIPVIFQSHGLTSLPSDQLLQAYAGFGRVAPRFIAFELGTMFAPFGKIYDLAVYESLLGIKERIGAKHSSLSRQL